MNFLAALNQFSKQRLSWLLLLVIIIGFELCALYFQHVMMLAPCVMCVYERVAMLGIAGFAAIGLLQPNNPLVRWVGLLGWAYSSYRGLELAREHVNYQFNPSPFVTCDFFPNFPSWAPLNEWVPWMFEPTGDCSKVVWQFFDLSMPQWLVVIFAGNLIACGVIMLSQFFIRKK